MPPVTASVWLYAAPTVPSGSVVVDIVSATTPVPLRLTVLGLLGALLVIVTAPVRVPVAVGVKVTLIVQSAPAASVVPQVVVREKSPLAAMLVIFSTALPVLLKVNVCAELVLPTLWLLNESAVVESKSIGADTCGVLAYKA